MFNIKFISRFVVPVIIISMSVITYYNANHNDQTRWRGGGFGMYTEIHWIRHEVWFDNVPDSLNFIKIYENDCQKIRRLPSADNLSSLAKKIKHDYGLLDFRIEYWRLCYDLKENRLYKRKVTELHVQ